MRAKLAALSLFVFIGAGICSAQQTAPAQASYSTVYCSGFVSDQRVPDATRLVSGKETNVKILFGRGDYVTINRGQDKGVRVGDLYSVVRAESDSLQMVNWFKWQVKLIKAMGTHYLDAGQLRVVNVQAKTAIAEVTLSCDYMQRGDIVRPMQDRPTPPYKAAEKFDRFAPVSRKPVGMLVYGQEFSQLFGKNSIVYLNLGSAQGVKVGDYIRAFRYQGSLAETAPNTKGYQYELFGFGSTPVRYEWKDLPREILGEGIVTYVSANASTVFITYDRIEMYAGDYAEVE